jgi:hypothetical protein
VGNISRFFNKIGQKNCPKPFKVSSWNGTTRKGDMQKHSHTLPTIKFDALAILQPSFNHPFNRLFNHLFNHPFNHPYAARRKRLLAAHPMQCLLKG